MKTSRGKNVKIANIGLPNAFYSVFYKVVTYSMFLATSRL